MDLEHLPVVGRLAAWSTALVDLFINSGEFVFIAVSFLLDNFELLYTAIRTLESLANRLPWLPAGVLQDLVTAVLVAVLFIEVARLTERALYQ